MSFVKRFIILCPYQGESTIRGSSIFDQISITLYSLKSFTTAATRFNDVLNITIYGKKE